MSVINTNLKSMMAQESMRTSNLKLSTTMERLATGLRINSAKDDAAGLAISNRMTAQVRGFTMAIRNANDGISMAQTADGAYGQVNSMLQRMRELAVQASTGSLTSSDRESLQLEIEELKTEIQNVAEKTNFNGIKLLDGTAQNISLQTGAFEGDQTEIGFASVQTKDIGSGNRPALTSVGGLVVDQDNLAMVSGDLVLNGVLVGPSLADDDTVSFGTTADPTAVDYTGTSAIAKAAAINRVSDASGVFATVNDNQVLGSIMTAAEQTGRITINGISTSEVTTTEDAEVSRGLVANAINNISDQTGVRAINTGDDRQGITLVADDGRNVTVEFTGTLDTATTGVGPAGTYVGTYSLHTVDGTAIEVGFQNGNEGTVDSSGLEIGTFSPDLAQMVTRTRTSNADAGTLSGDTLVINGYAIGAAKDTDDTASADMVPDDDPNFTAITNSSKADSAIAIAAAINRRSSEHGVTAIAEANVLRGDPDTAAYDPTAEGDLFINGVTIALAATSRDNVIDKINEFTGQTGVVASAWGEAIQLSAEDGRNISLAADGLTNVQLGLDGYDFGADVENSNTYYASVRLVSDKAFTVSRGNEDTVEEFEALGFRVGTFGGSDTGVKIAEIDVSTQQGASAAITAIDAAIDDVAAAQARSGAFQNRLDAAVSVLAESVENTSAGRSRILDTDYATETTALAKAQIVQQAATAMLAQANQQSQSVLALLQ